MGRYVLGLEDADRAHVAVVGGKGAHLGALTRIDGIRVPAGFCVTTEAFRRVVADVPSIDGHLDRLARLTADDRDAIGDLSAQVRQSIGSLAVPDDLAEEVTRRLGVLGEGDAYAVRSSATAEDLPSASFAGQQDTYLNVVGPAAILDHVRRCWASLFTERAVTYRLRNGIDQRKVQMAVVVQRMVAPQAAGVLFTAHPVSSNREVASVEAIFGLGEALVTGAVTPDTYEVRDGEVIARSVAVKNLAVNVAPGGGTVEEAVEPARREQAVLTDAQVVGLVQLGRRIEAHLGHPQDIEWCLADGDFVIVQSRPITTLFPIPEAGDDGNHVYVSVGHQQMMTDPMKPLGLSVWQLTTPRPMAEAGGRLFVDVTPILASPASRDGFVKAMGASDPLIGDALRAVVDRDGFLPTLPESADTPPVGPVAGHPSDPIETDPTVVDELIELTQRSLATVEREIRGRSGAALLDFILDDFQELRRVLFEPRSHQVITAGMEATAWLNENLEAWLYERNAAGTLARSAPNNITSEMGLALLDVADVVCRHPDVVAFLQEVEDDDFLGRLPEVPGGQAARDAIQGYLDRYGMRCVGEIDITRPRWSERPSALLPMILANVRNFEPGAGERRFERGRQEAARKREEILERLRALPDGEEKAAETEAMIDRLRTFIGFREYPKYGMVSRYFIYKRALLEEAGRLVQAGVLRQKEDIYYLRFQELQGVVRTGEVDEELIRAREEAFRSYGALTPPRVLTSDGEVVAGSYRRDDVPEGAMIGLGVSGGTVEGRARVVADTADADLEAGDILVTAYTDPSWTPAFVAVEGLVTEVGGMMTHGAVIAREYGLPAVVGVERATALIEDGQRIRVHGTHGYVEILDPPLHVRWNPRDIYSRPGQRRGPRRRWWTSPQHRS